MFWRESERARAGGAAAGWSGACDCACVSVRASKRVCVCMCKSSVRVLSERVFILPCLLLSDATSNCVSWATRGPCYVFFFFFSSCPRRKREPIAVLLPSERGGLFSLHFHPWYLPIDSYRRNKSNSNSISIHVSFLQWFIVAFFFKSAAQRLPTNTLAANEVFRKLCDISEEEMYKSRWRTAGAHAEIPACTVAPELWSPVRAQNMARLQGNKIKWRHVFRGICSVSHSLKKQSQTYL